MTIRILAIAYRIASGKVPPTGATADNIAELAIESLAGSRIHPFGMIENCRALILGGNEFSPRVKDLAKHELRPDL